MAGGYIVWNLTNYNDGYEIFGVYRTREAAEKQFKKVLKNRFGKLPKDTDELLKWEDEVAEGTGCLDSFRITPFVENIGD